MGENWVRPGRGGLRNGSRFKVAPNSASPVALRPSFPGLAPETLRILFTAYTEMEVLIRAINQGEVFRFIRKAWEDAELVGAVLSAPSHHELILENRRLLATVRRHQETLEGLERAIPGLTRMPPRDDDGAFTIEHLEGGSQVTR